ncbi:SnoaL-like protein [Humitalea rosea]|uniref:SnoaL-like protein n=1 Tax=Humitalea rosea TaxID=990373 RepID=A0A2W7IDZ3_9PROT|nr:nuclear transport factor 2 family protein [Humitalea rosea]PZW45110.1 SnoaL-like protein [Humitalea rosea]
MLLAQSRRAAGVLALGVVLATAGCAAIPSPAQAGPPADMAHRRIAAIAAGDSAAIQAGYAGDAVLEWVGGPLDGRYTGASALAEVWGKFARAQGMMQARVGSVLESANPRGQTVVADVIFTGRATVKVRYVMVFRDGKLASEVWQIDPNLPG